MHGSIGPVQTLPAEDLVDELRTIVVPVVLGRGRRLFEGGAAPRTWGTVSSATTPTGAVMTAQRRVGGITTGSYALKTPEESDVPTGDGVRSPYSVGRSNRRCGGTVDLAVPTAPVTGADRGPGGAP